MYFVLPVTNGAVGLFIFMLFPNVIAKSVFSRKLLAYLSELTVTCRGGRDVK